MMTYEVTLIGFGEAAQTFATAADWGQGACAYDRLTDDLDTRATKVADYAAAGVSWSETVGPAVRNADIVVSLVTADQALQAARAAGEHMPSGSLFCDMNSVAPATKRRAAEAIARAGAEYVDVAILAPVKPARLGAPLLVSGGQAERAAEQLRGLGFSQVRVVGPDVGQASAIKMIRSIIVKGMEALTAECVLAGEAAGVITEVLASLNASDTSQNWEKRADYNLERMIVHGLRRAEEMKEVVTTLEDLGIEPVMTLGTVRRQFEIGNLGLSSAPDGLAAKLALINRRPDAA